MYLAIIGHWFPGRKGNRCTECGDCLPRCPENLDIPKLLQDTRLTVLLVEDYGRNEESDTVKHRSNM